MYRFLRKKVGLGIRILKYYCGSDKFEKFQIWIHDKVTFSHQCLAILIGGLFKSIYPTENQTGPASETTGILVPSQFIGPSQINLGTLKSIRLRKKFPLAFRNENVTKLHCKLIFCTWIFGTSYLLKFPILYFPTGCKLADLRYGYLNHYNIWNISQFASFYLSVSVTGNLFEIVFGTNLTFHK